MVSALLGPSPIDGGPFMPAFVKSQKRSYVPSLSQPWPLYLLLAFQFVCALVFVGELATEVFGLRTTPIPYEWQELIQILASVGLISGVVATAFYVRRSATRIKNMGTQLDVAAGQFENHLGEMFTSWDLSQSEQSVAILAMKGFSNAEVSDMRGTSVSTIKSQMNSIYKKSGLANRQQLISFLVEELLAEADARTLK